MNLFIPNPMVMIRGKEVRFGAKQINGVYGLDNIYMTDYEAKYFALGSWLAEHLRLGRGVS